MTSIKRLPWSGSDEFIKVFELLYSNLDSINQKSFQSLALNHLNAWLIRSPNSLPPSIESTHDLIHSILFKSKNSHLHRLALSMALTRFVNNLLDPLQTGLYAKSLAQIANQLGLPLSFVQIRHRATHEDLPSLLNLLQSANLALDWLYSNYWLPTFNSLIQSNQSFQSIQSINLNKFIQLLTQYKRTRKITLLDNSNSNYLKILNQINQNINLLSRQISQNHHHHHHINLESIQSNQIHLQSLNLLCIAMSQNEILVPRSLRKRSRSLKASLPHSLKSLYDPLINHLTQSYPVFFIRSLIMTLLDVLDETYHQSLNQNLLDPTYYYTCTAWLVDLLKRSIDHDLGKETLWRLLSKPNIYSISVIESLKEIDPPSWLHTQNIAPLLNLLQQNNNQNQKLTHDQIQSKIITIKERWAKLSCFKEEIVVQGSQWPLVNEAEWSPCLIGCLPGDVVPELYQSIT
ncbi:hypothetical protein O181_102221 [Austropuccinia psidii MF-1]|uniref:Las1-like protein n=1 Tax=Austropuccinia psidii MF-1 TaxID=1389203 RepID=A0A9Q3PJD4_9BASI|nr:hypothetical protein [Austropuccinia psidii MF-1]